MTAKVLYRYKGKDYNIEELADVAPNGLSSSAIRKRIKDQNYTVERAVEEPKVTPQEACRRSPWYGEQVIPDHMRRKPVPDTEDPVENSDYREQVCAYLERVGYTSILNPHELDLCTVLSPAQCAKAIIQHRKANKGKS